MHMPDRGLQRATMPEPAWLARLLTAIPVHLRQRRLLVALSGGLDSTLLLYGLAALHRAGEIGVVEALHVHHGLQAGAEAWAEHVQQFAERLDLPLRVLRVKVRLEAGLGVEGAAREARYAALTGEMRAGDVLLTAHHLDDQAETFVLQLMRGAGVRGLAAMPALQPIPLCEGVGWHLRPWLSVPRQILHNIAVQLGLEWVDDPSNQDRRFARNLVRHAVLPVLAEHWSQVRQTLARCAQRMATTETLLLDLARIDLQVARTDVTSILQVEPLRRLSAPRLQNAIRAWLLELGLPAPPEARLHELSRVLDARVDAMPVLAWSGGVLRRWRGGLYAFSEHPVNTAWPGCFWSLLEPLELPMFGIRLVARPGLGCGLRATQLREGVYVCTRQATTLPVGASRTRLSKRLQQLDVPPWLREQLPLVYLGSSLLQISDMWLSPAHRAQAGEDGRVIAVEYMS